IEQNLVVVEQAASWGPPASGARGTNMATADWHVRHAWLRYGLVLAVIALLTWARLLLDPVLGDRSPLLLYTPAVGFAGRLGGFGPALTALAAGEIASIAFLATRRSPQLLHEPEHLAALVLFLLVGLVVALLGAAMRAAQYRAEAIALEARGHE